MLFRRRLLRLQYGRLTSPLSLRYNSGMGKRGNSSTGGTVLNTAQKGKSFCDDVMQAVFSFFL